MCYKDIGPYFGVIRELAAWTEPFNGEGNCVCYANHRGYGIAQNEKGINLLTKSENGPFTIRELEVWKIVFD